MIWVQIPLKPTAFSVKFVFETNENKQKEVGVGPFFKAKNEGADKLVRNQKKNKGRLVGCVIVIVRWFDCGKP